MNIHELKKWYANNIPEFDADQINIIEELVEFYINHSHLKKGFVAKSKKLTKYVTLKEPQNLRLTPSIDSSNIIGTVDSIDAIEVIDENDDWFQISVRKKTSIWIGWIKKRALTISWNRFKIY